MFQELVFDCIDFALERVGLLQLECFNQISLIGLGFAATASYRVRLGFLKSCRVGSDGAN